MVLSYVSRARRSLRGAVRPGPRCRAALLWLLALSLIAGAVRADEPGARNYTLARFLEEVAAGNLDYAARRYDVSRSEAAVKAAREFANPTLELENSRDVTHRGSERLPEAFGVSLTQTIETGGERKHRIKAARLGRAAEAASLEDFWIQLKAEASSAFVEALAAGRRLAQLTASADYLANFVRMQEIRHRAGEISRADYLGSLVEQRQFLSGLKTAEAEAETAGLQLAVHLGEDGAGDCPVPVGELDLPAADFDLVSLVASAAERRPDLAAMRLEEEVAHSRVDEVRAARIPNLDVGVGWVRSSRSDNEIAASPRFDTVGATLSLPLPLWNRNGSAVLAARLEEQQAGVRVRAAERRAALEIRQALTRYRGAAARVETYRDGLLEDALEVLSAREAGYRQGQIGIVDLLDARRTLDGLRDEHLEALEEQAKALIELHRVSGRGELPL